MATPHSPTLLTADAADDRAERHAIAEENGTAGGHVLGNEAIRTLFRELAKIGIHLDNEQETVNYLHKHPDLVGVLGGICRTARTEFGPTAALLVKVYRDPELHDVFLALFVRLHSYAGGVFQRLEKVRQAHQADLAGLDGSFLVTSDYRPL